MSGHIRDTTVGKLGLVPYVLLLSKSFTPAGSVLHEWEIRSAQHDYRVLSLRCQPELRVRVAKHVQAVNSVVRGEVSQNKKRRAVSTAVSSR
jgi:hypothetical protein